MPRIALLLAVVLAAGCGSAAETDGTGAAATTSGATTPAPVETVPPASSEEGTTVLVYFLRDGLIAAAHREVPATPDVARAALEALAEGPDERERAAGLTTSVPRRLGIERLSVAGGTARVDFEAATGCPSIAQIVYTLTQFATVERVAGNCIPRSAYGAGLTRADLEDVTPQILVESPTVGEPVRSPLRLTGTANTYEATFMVNVTDADGHVVASTFVTATSGNGERGTFDATVPFEVDRPGGRLVVFEASAEDGSALHLVEIPLDLRPA